MRKDVRYARYKITTTTKKNCVKKLSQICEKSSEMGYINNIGYINDMGYIKDARKTHSCEI